MIDEWCTCMGWEEYLIKGRTGTRSGADCAWELRRGESEWNLARSLNLHTHTHAAEKKSMSMHGSWSDAPISTAQQALFPCRIIHSFLIEHWSFVVRGGGGCRVQSWYFWIALIDREERLLICGREEGREGVEGAVGRDVGGSGGEGRVGGVDFRRVPPLRPPPRLPHLRRLPQIRPLTHPLVRRRDPHRNLTRPHPPGGKGPTCNPTAQYYTVAMVEYTWVVCIY